MLVSRNIELGQPLRASTWRKIAIGTWRTAGDPSVYASLDMDVERALEYMEKMREKTGLKITLTHFVGKALANVFYKHPELNCVLRFGRLYPRKSIDVFYQVATDVAGKDLSGTTIRNADKKSISEIAMEIQEKANRIRQHGDPDFKKVKSTIGIFPGFLMRSVINFTGLLMYGLNLWSPLLGSPKDPFGSFMVTSIGSLGLDSAFAPLVPYSRVPLIIAVGAIREVPVVRGGQVVVRKVSRLCVTFDHRLMDGLHRAYMAKMLTGIFENPEQMLG